jgi:hypothetical protein
LAIPPLCYPFKSLTAGEHREQCDIRDASQK